jgi:toxin FitB
VNFLIDTNVISEPRRPQPNAGVLNWFEGVDTLAVFISVLTVGELVRGVTKISSRDRRAGRRLREWVDEVEAEYGPRIVSVDRAIAARWGEITAAHTLPMVDSLLAATALVHGMTLVTRNTRDMAATGVPLLNPWYT